jgi:hypothetical protein
VAKQCLIFSLPFFIALLVDSGIGIAVNLPNLKTLSWELPSKLEGDHKWRFWDIMQALS